MISCSLGLVWVRTECFVVSFWQASRVYQACSLTFNCLLTRLAMGILARMRLANTWTFVSIGLNFCSLVVQFFALLLSRRQIWVLHLILEYKFTLKRARGSLVKCVSIKCLLTYLHTFSPDKSPKRTKKVWEHNKHALALWLSLSLSLVKSSIIHEA